jgi:hypothetical protein
LGFTVLGAGLGVTRSLVADLLVADGRAVVALGMAVAVTAVVVALVVVTDGPVVVEELGRAAPVPVGAPFVVSGPALHAATARRGASTASARERRIGDLRSQRQGS